MMIKLQSVLPILRRLSKDSSGVKTLDMTYFGDRSINISSQKNIFVMTQAAAAFVKNDHRPAPSRKKLVYREARTSSMCFIFATWSGKERTFQALSCILRTTRSKRTDLPFKQVSIHQQLASSWRGRKARIEEVGNKRWGTEETSPAESWAIFQSSAEIVFWWRYSVR